MKMHDMKSDQVRPTECSASQQASWDVFFFPPSELTSPCVTDKGLGLFSIC